MQKKIFLICNPGETFLFSPEHVYIISTYSEWQQVCKSGAIENASCFIIVSELSWNGALYLDHVGFEYVNKLRLQYHYKGPILVSSIFPKEELGYYSFKGKFRYWKDPSLFFVHYSEILIWDSSALIKKVPRGLDDALYRDLCESVYEIRGIINEEFHFFDGEKRNKPSEVEQLLIALFDRLISYFPNESMALEKLAAKSQKILQDEGDIDSEVLLQKVAKVLGNPGEESEKVRFVSEKDPTGKVLYIDDSQEEILLEALNKAGFEVYYEREKIDALNRLREDILNEITVVICNYRFLDEDRRIKWDQGYHIIEAICKLPNILSYITLTSSHPSNLSIQEQQVLSVYKQHVLGPNGIGNLFGFIRLIGEEHARIQQAIVDLVPKKRWKGEMLWNYKVHRESRDYLSTEKWISDTSLSLLEMIANQNVKKNSIKEMRAFEFQKKFHKNRSQENLSNFRRKLLGRRIALGLCQTSKLSVYKEEDRWYVIDSFLKTGCFDVKIDQNPLNLINTHLKLSKKRHYPYNATDGLGLTIEERNWLKQYGYYVSNL